MAEPKPFASLTSGLLARKGGARPAMRRQSINLANAQPSHLEDLGWNDMGYDVDPETETHAPPSITFKPLANAIPEVVRQQDRLAAEMGEEEAAESINESEAEVEAEESAGTPLSNAVKHTARATDDARPRKTMALPPVNAAEQADALEAAAASPVAEMVAAKPERAVQPVAPVRSANSGKRAAFTLRVDPDRHLRLRLACAVRGQSAQALVTEALDQFLNSMPEVDELARRVPNTAAEMD